MILNRGNNGLGLGLAGGISENRPIEITDIYPNQPAALSGRLEIGDVILSINDTLMYNRNVRVCWRGFKDDQTHVSIDCRMCHQLSANQHETRNCLFVDRICENIALIW